MTKSRSLLVALAAAGMLGAAGYGLYAIGVSRGLAAASTAAAPAAALQPLPQTIAEGEAATRRHLEAGLEAGKVDPVTGRKILYYHDPMVPGNRFDKPAKSPFMDMMLVPMYADSDADASTVTISPRVRQNLGLRTAAVVEEALTPQLEAVGSIAWNERDQVVVPARATAFVERLHVRATLDRVAPGQALVELYVPDWIAAQEEFLALRGRPQPDLAALVDGARARLRQAGMNEAQIAQVEATGRTQPRITLVAPIGGVVTELAVREGMTVMAGATLLRINGTGTVWAHGEVPESQAALLRPGARVQARSPAVPGAVFGGAVQALLPAVDPATRTRRARVELANAGGRLVPGMFVQMRFSGLGAGRALLVPTEAVIQTGRRTLVMLALDGGAFRPVEVETGIESGGRTEIKRGLQAGQRVVVSAQFLLDSEASLKGVEARLGGDPAAEAAADTPADPAAAAASAGGPR